MWIDAIGGENELGPVREVGVGGEESVAGTCGAGSGSEARAADIVI